MLVTTSNVQKSSPHGGRGGSNVRLPFSSSRLFECTSLCVRWLLLVLSCHPLWHLLCRGRAELVVRALSHEPSVLCSGACGVLCRGPAASCWAYKGIFSRNLDTGRPAEVNLQNNRKSYLSQPFRVTCNMPKGLTQGYRERHNRQLL